jgi:hypothetical protein
MPGRSWLRLLAILFVMFPLALSQSDRFSPTSDSTKPESSASVAAGASPFSPSIVERRSPAQPISLPHPIPVTPMRFRRNPVPWRTIGFPQIARTAAVIFSGTVTAIARSPAARGSTIDTVAITFHVDQAIRGATTGENLKVSQWMGVWSGGQRYSIGERVLLFLYPRSRLGLTSVVGAGLGRFAIDGQGHILLNAQHMNAFGKDQVLGGKSQVGIGDFLLAVRRSEEEFIP